MLMIFAQLNPLIISLKYLSSLLSLLSIVIELLLVAFEIG